MTVALIIISHDIIGPSLLKTATETVRVCPMVVKTLCASRDSDPDRLYAKALALTREMNSEDGILVLTDLYGSTPSNIAARLLNDIAHVRVVTGINLPMLLRILNYSSLPLDQLVQKAVSGGKNGIIEVSRDKV